MRHFRSKRLCNKLKTSFCWTKKNWLKNLIFRVYHQLTVKLHFFWVICMKDTLCKQISPLQSLTTCPFNSNLGFNPGEADFGLYSPGLLMSYDFLTVGSRDNFFQYLLLLLLFTPIHLFTFLSPLLTTHILKKIKLYIEKHSNLTCVKTL